MEKIKHHKNKIEIREEAFARTLSRPPKNQNEFDQWATCVEKGLWNSWIDWDFLYERACEAAGLKKRSMEVV